MTFWRVYRSWPFRLGVAGLTAVYAKTVLSMGGSIWLILFINPFVAYYLILIIMHPEIKDTLMNTLEAQYMIRKAQITPETIIHVCEACKGMGCSDCHNGGYTVDNNKRERTD